MGLNQKKGYGMVGRKEFTTIILIVMVTIVTVIPIIILVGLQGESDWGSGRLPAEWEEAFEWMENLNASTVIASWKDYGEYINTYTNCTPLDFTNETVVGLVGRLFMAENESESIEIMAEWNATYVLVCWSYYYPGGGGDEGKWPLMIESAHDQLQGTKWEIEVGERWNDTSSKPTCEFFNTTLWKMLTYGEPFIDYDLEWGLVELLIMQGIPFGYFPARLNWADPWVPGSQPYQGLWEDDSGHLWKYHNPPLGAGMVDDGVVDYDGDEDDDTVGVFENLNNFTPVFNSSAHRIKIFEIK